MSVGCTPALKILILGGFKCLATASAIWLRQALFSSKKRIFRSRIVRLMKCLLVCYAERLVAAVWTLRLTLKTSCKSSPFFRIHCVSPLVAAAAEPTTVKVFDFFNEQVTDFIFCSCRQSKA